VANDLNVVGGCETVTSASLSITQHTDLITALGRHFVFVIPHLFLSNDGFLVLMFVRD